jgi:endonuclease/exonuclease/phosphatase family metal-dependent hydrolase
LLKAFTVGADTQKAGPLGRAPFVRTLEKILSTTPRTRLVAAMATRGSVTVAAALLALLGSGLAAPASASSSMRVGSYNIRAGVSVGTFENAAHSIMQVSDVAGLQEVNSHAKEDVLRSLSDNGWDYYRPAQGTGEQNPVIWSSARFTELSARSSRLAPSHYVGGETAAHRTPAVYAAVVRLRDELNGNALTVINVHLVPGAVINGRPTPHKPRLFRAYRESVINLGRLVSAETSNAPTYVTGDYNVGWVADKRVHLTNLPYATFARQHKHSMWATQRPSGNRGSHVGSPALIDQVYAAQMATSARVFYSTTYSDHYPVVATYTVG